MARYTISDLRNDVARYNGYLEEMGSSVRFREQGRNGYQAIDEYEIQAGGSWSCMRMVGGGTSREVLGYMAERYGAIYTRSLEDQINALKA